MNSVRTQNLVGVKLPMRLKNMFAKFDELNLIKRQDSVLLFHKDYVALSYFCARRFGEPYRDLSNVRYIEWKIRTYTE